MMLGELVGLCSEAARWANGSFYPELERQSPSLHLPQEDCLVSISVT